MKKIIIFLLLLSIVSLYSKEKKDLISTKVKELADKDYKWSLNFKYDNIVIETKKDKNNNIIESVYTDYGQTDLNLLIIDNIQYIFEKNYNLNIVKYLKEADYYIIIHPTKPQFSYIVIEILIMDKNKEIIEREIVQDLYDGFDDLNEKIVTKLTKMLEACE